MTDAPGVQARVDRLVDENGNTIMVAPDTAIGVGPRTTGTVGATGPTGWWLIGLGVLAALVATVLVLQLAGGGAPSATPPPTDSAGA